MESKIAHLTFLQGVVNRMGNNSFLVKGWSITLTAALFALSSQNANSGFVLVAYFPVVLFWLLDGFFLHQEKLFRKLYEKVARGEVSSDVFTMDTSQVSDETPSFERVLFSKTLLPFHGTVFGAILFVMFCIFR